jgi:hypothetical protein
MKVVCIKKEGNDWVTGPLNIGDTYEVLESAYGSDQKARRGVKAGILKDTLFYKIKTRNGSLCWILSTNFKSLEEAREDKINEIIN